MSAVTIDGLDDWVLASYRSRAEASGRTVEEELRQGLARGARTGAAGDEPWGELTDAELAARWETVEAFRRVRGRIVAEHGTLPDSTPEIREDRDSWG